MGLYQSMSFGRQGPLAYGGSCGRHSSGRHPADRRSPWPNARPPARAAERKAVKQAAAEGRRTKAGKNTEQDVLDAITAMDGSDREIAEGMHQLVRRVTPDLVPRTWYGFPAYAKWYSHDPDPPHRQQGRRAQRSSGARPTPELRSLNALPSATRESL